MRWIPEIFGVAQGRRRRGKIEPAHVAAQGVTLEDQGRVVLDEASFELPQGGLALLETPSADDCKAFYHLLAGLQQPKSGALLIDGAPPVASRDRPGRIVISTPTTRLFRGAIMENLTLFGAAADADDALHAMQLLNLDSVVGKLPAGYDTMVSMGAGESLSQAHLRLIVIARALAQRPSLLLLDRPELYLDPAAEETLYKALQRFRSQTTIVIRSDRPGAAAIADERLTLRDGWFKQERLSHPDAAQNVGAAS